MPVKGGPNIQTAQALVFLDSADKLSYPGTGTTWTNTVSPGTFNGTLANGVGFNSSDALGALLFTSSNSYVDVGNIGAISASFSFQVAVKPFPTSSGGVYTILSYTSGSGTGSLTFKLDYSSSSQIATLSTFVSSGSVNQVYNLTASVSTGSWSILHGIFGSGVFNFYKNGTPVSSIGTTGSFTGYSTNNRLLVGGISQFTGSYLSGSVANVAVYNSSLSRRSIANNYNGLATRFGLPNIVAPSADEDIQGFFDRVAAAGGVLTLQEETAITTLVTDLKTYGLWSKMKAIYPMVGASAAACRQNLRSNDFTGIFTSGWTFASTGVTPNGTTSCFFDTKFPLNTIGTNNNSMGFYTRTNLIESAAEIGTDQNYNMGANFSGFGAFARNLNIAAGGFTNSDTRGFYNNSRIISTNYQYYKNATLLGTITATSTTPSATHNIALAGEMQTGNTAVRVPSSKEFSFAFIGDGLNDSENTLYYTAVQKFQTTLNRQV